MADYSKLSDAELAALLAKGKPTAKDYSKLSDAELAAQLAMPVAPAQPAIGQLETALRGSAQGLSMNLGDELTGAAGNVAGKLGIVPDMGYDYYRDYARNQDKAAEAANPKTYMGSQLAGAVGTAAIPGFGVANGLGKTVLQGAAQGGIAGAGASESTGLGDIATDAAKGVALGGAGGAAGYGVGKALPYIGSGLGTAGDYLRSGAKSMAGRALGAERGTIKSLGEKAVDDAGGYALDNNLFSIFGGTKGTISRNASEKAKAMADRKGVYDTLDAYGPSSFNPLNVAAKVDEKIGGHWRTPINKGETKQLENTLESITMRGDKGISIAEAQALKEELGKVANWKSTLNPTEKEQMARGAYGVVAGELTNAADQGAKAIGVDGLAETLKAANKKYSAAKAADVLLENKAAREAGNKWGGITDWSLLGGALPAYMVNPIGLPLALGALATKKGLEKYGPQVAARSLNTGSKGLKAFEKILESQAAPIANSSQVIGRAVGSSPWLNMKEGQK